MEALLDTKLAHEIPLGRWLISHLPSIEIRSRDDTAYIVVIEDAHPVPPRPIGLIRVLPVLSVVRALETADCKTHMLNVNPHEMCLIYE